MTITLATAERASQLGGHLYVDLRTPGVAWAEAGLEETLPGSFIRMRALADRPVELQTECDRILADFADAIDADAIAIAAEEATQGGM